MRITMLAAFALALTTLAAGASPTSLKGFETSVTTRMWGSAAVEDVAQASHGLRVERNEPGWQEAKSAEKTAKKDAKAADKATKKDAKAAEKAAKKDAKAAEKAAKAAEKAAKKDAREAAKEAREAARDAAKTARGAEKGGDLDDDDHDDVDLNGDAD